MSTVIAETTTFISEQHKARFHELMKIQMVTRPKIFKREIAVIYLVSALHYEKPEELFNPKGCYPNVDVAIARYIIGELDERDAVVFLLAQNLFNGLDEFESFGIQGQATPYHFACLLRDEAFLMAEATNLFMNGYNQMLIQ